MNDSDTKVLALVAALTNPVGRKHAAENLAAHFGAEALFASIHDPGLEGGFAPAPGFPELPEGDDWRALMERALSGRRNGCVRWPGTGAAMPAVAWSHAGLVLVLAGGDVTEARLDSFAHLSVILSAILCAEHAGARASQQVQQAEYSASETAALASALDRTRLDLETTSHRIEQLQQATGQLARALGTREVASVLLEASGEAVDQCAGVVYLADAAGSFRLARWHGVEAFEEDHRLLDLEGPLPLATAIRSRRPLWIESYQDLLAQYPDVATAKIPRSRLQAVAALPLLHGDRVVGGLALSFDRSMRFDHPVRELLQGLASQCAIAAERARLYDEEHAARFEAEALFRIADSLNTADLDVDALLQRATDQATTLAGAAFGAFFYNAEGQGADIYELYTLSGASKEDFESFGMPRKTPLFAPTFSGDAVVRVDDIRADPRYGKMPPHYGLPKGHLPVTSYLAVPVVTNDGTVIGGLFFGHPERGRFTEQHERLVKALAAGAAVAIARKRAEDAVRKSELQLRTISDSLPTLIALLGRDYRYRFANAAYRRWFGLDPESLIGKHPKDVLGDAAVRAVEPYIRRALAGEEVSVSLPVPYVFGTRHIDARLVPVREQGEDVTGWVALVNDITERVRREAKERVLAQATALLLESVDVRTTLEELTQLVVPDLAEWCLLYVEDQGEPMRLIAHADPTKVKWAEELYQRWPPRATDSFGPFAVMRSGTPQLFEEVDDELVAQHARDPEHREVLRRAGMKSYLCVPLRAREQMIGALTFVSGEGGRRLDATDLELAQELANRAALCVHNARLYREAQEANHAKDQFLAMLGHELRNPLSPILTAVQLMKMKLGNQLPKERAIIERQVQHLMRLVDDLLDISRITRGKVELRRQRLELFDVVVRAVESSAPLLDQQKHKLLLDVPRKGLPVDGDEDRLIQVVSNLLTNAAKYTEADGRIEVKAAEDGHQVVLRVRDTGIGISPELLPRLFELFVQGQSTIDRSHGGLGLGLAIVWSLVTMHGGSITAHSAGLGRGSEFVVRLPRASSKRPLASDGIGTSPGAERRPNRRGERVLVVDDNRDAADALAEALEAAGYVICMTYDGPSALKRALEFRPDIALLDIGLPVMTGYELAQRLRSLPGLRNIKLVAVTGYGRAADRKRAREAGFHDHLVKPVSLDQLERCFTRLLPAEQPRASG